MSDAVAHSPMSHLDHRSLKNFLSATAMLGHLCALYDRGVYESARLISNLLFQLTVARGRNNPLLRQIDAWDSVRVIVDTQTRSTRLSPSSFSSTLVGLIFGARRGPDGALQPVSMLLPAMRTPGSGRAFDALAIDMWLEELVIPTSQKVLSRLDLITAVRDQDGGAHSDVTEKLYKSVGYEELVNSFPISKSSELKIHGHSTIVWDQLPPVSLPILRQIAHELLSAIYSYTDVRSYLELSTLVCLFRETQLLGAFVPDLYPNIGPVHDKIPATIASSDKLASSAALHGVGKKNNSKGQ